MLLAATLCAAGPDQTGRLDPADFERYGGTYSIDCSDAEAERMEVHVDRLIWVRAGGEWVSKDIEGVIAWWGNRPHIPENFEIVLLANFELEKAPFIVYRDEKRGLFIDMGDEDSVAGEEDLFKCKAEGE